MLTQKQINPSSTIRGEWQLTREVQESSLDRMFDLNRGPVARMVARASQLILRLLFRLSFQLRIHGLEKIPEVGPFLLCPNHQSYLDPFFVYALLPSAVRERTLFVADREYFQKPSLSWMNRFGRILLTGSSGRRPECLRLAGDALRRGMVVCMFPEGRRTKTGLPMKPYRGTGILACTAKVPVVPVHISGGLQVFSNFYSGFQFCRISLTVGESIDPDLIQGCDFQIVLERWSDAVRMESQPRGVFTTNAWTEYSQT